MYEIKENYLTPNEFSRPGTKLNSLKGIVVHWVENPLSSANANRNFFEMRKKGKTGYGSAHFIIDLDGNIIKCLPEEEQAYHVGAKQYTSAAIENLSTNPNDCTIGVECTHIDFSGKMTRQTYSTLVEFLADLFKKNSLSPKTDLYRHFDITGKNCHKWFIDNPNEWEMLKQSVEERMNNMS